MENFSKTNFRSAVLFQCYFHRFLLNPKTSVNWEVHWHVMHVMEHWWNSWKSQEDIKSACAAKDDAFGVRSIFRGSQGHQSIWKLKTGVSRRCGKSFIIVNWKINQGTWNINRQKSSKASISPSGPFHCNAAVHEAGMRQGRIWNSEHPVFDHTQRDGSQVLGSLYLKDWTWDDIDLLISMVDRP